MSYRAIYTYAWDLAETGVAAAADEFRALGLDTVTMAGSYHAGKFMRPHGQTGKVYFPEDGTAYFRHDPARYGALQPAANSISRATSRLAGWSSTTRTRGAWPVR